MYRISSICANQIESDRSEPKSEKQALSSFAILWFDFKNYLSSYFLDKNVF